MANKQLTAKVRLNTTSAEKSIDRLVTKINQIDKAMNQVNRQGKQNQHYAKNLRQVDSITNRVRAWAAAQRQVTFDTRSTGNALSMVTGKLRRLASTYLGVMGTKAVMDSTDLLVGAQNRFNNINGGDTAATQEALDKMYASSQKTRSSYQDMISNVSKTMTLAGDAFGDNIDNAIRFQEIMAKAYAVGGASDQEKSTSMYQLTQALGSGYLQGDELRSVREGAPLAYQAIEKFAQGVHNTEKSLKDMASQGLITSEIVVAAVMEMGSGIDEAFAKTRQTFGQTFDQIKNAALYAFQPIMEKLTDMLNKAIDNGLIQKFEILFTGLAKGMLIAFEIIERIVTWVYNSWALLNKLFATTAVVLGTVLLGALILNLMTAGSLVKTFILAKIEAIKAAFTSAASWLTLCPPLTIILALLAAVIIAVIWVADSFADACGIICGLINVVNGVLMNAIIFIINMISGVIGFIRTACDQIAIAFNNAWQSAKVAFWEWVSECLNGTGLIAKAVSKIAELFGLDAVSIDAKIGAAKSKMQESKTQEDFLSGFNLVEYQSLADMYQSGYDWGFSNINGLQDKLGNFSLDKIGEKLGLDFSGMTTPFPNDALSTDDIGDLLKGIKGDTGAISDSMELTSEDLEYLRRVADMEWKKEYTTAEIKIDMTNNNQINGENDLDGIVTRLADKLYEEMNVVANGVYAY